MRLTAKGVKGLACPGKYYDGDGLLLHVMSATRRVWYDTRFHRAHIHLTDVLSVLSTGGA